MRFLKFTGAIVGTVLIIFLLAFGFNLDALFTLFENQEDLQEGQEWVDRTSSLKDLTFYIAEHPENVSVASLSPANPDISIRYATNTPHTMGTLSNFFLLATYARLVVEGTTHPEELVTLSEIERYQLPFIDASNHEEAVNDWRNQDVITSNNEVSLQHLVQSIISYNDLAASDFLYHKLGLKAITVTYDQLDLKDTDLPLPFSGLYITLHPELADTSFEAHFSMLSELSSQNYRDTVLTSMDSYLNNQNFHQKVSAAFEDNKGLGIQFRKRRDMLTLFPQSTAEELSRLMVQVQDGTLISPKVSEIIRHYMSRPYQNHDPDISTYGAIYDSRFGMSSGIDFGVAAGSKKFFAQAVFFDSLQIAFWLHMNSNQINRDYQQRLIWDPALRRATPKDPSLNS